MRKFLHSTIIAFILFSVFFIGCSNEESVTTISWWSFPNFDETGSFEQTLIDAFESKNPNINIELEMLSFSDGAARIETAIASDYSPDLTYDSPGRIISWANEGYLVPINDIIEPVKSNLAEGPLAASMANDGNYYMYPVHTGGFMMAFNKNMLEDLGLLDMLPYKRGNRAWTLQEYESLLRALKEKLPVGKVPAVFYAKSTAGDQGTRAFMVNLHGNAPLMNESLTEYTFNNNNAVKNVEWLQMAVSEGLMLNGATLQSNDAIDLYTSSSAASTILFSLQLEKMHENNITYNGEYFESIYMPYPNSSGDPILEFIVGGPAIFNNGDEKKIEAAKRFIEFIAQDETYAPMLIEATGVFPVSNKISVDINTDEQKWNAYAVNFFGAYYNTVDTFTEMRGFWYQAMQDALSGGDAKKTLDNYVKQANSN